jgi:hypothetical protein
MSYGAFSYRDMSLHSEMYDGNDNPFKDAKVSELMLDMFNLIHSLDGDLSGDTDSYIQDLEEFKSKWGIEDGEKDIH